MQLMLRAYTYYFLPTALAAALAFMLLPTAASAALSGTAELEYVKYDVDKNGSRELGATSFRHNYSLTYNKAGSFMGGRLGAYKGMFGYEWGSFDTKIVTPSETLNPSISVGNFLYSGDLFLDPREIPLRLTLYSRDTLRNIYQRDTLTSIANSGDRLIAPGVMTDIVNSGINTESGATLRLGVKNGMTNGYNAIFRHIPLLLIDYKDVIRKSDFGQQRVDTRLKNLAFISLNKKDNWFHYRVTKFADNISPSRSYTRTQIQLGTVDERLNRRWVDFTNWIKLSADIQFTRYIEADHLPEETYDGHLFLIATRKNWELRNFNTFARNFDHNGRKVQLERTVPIFLNGIWGRETDWSLRLSSEEKSERPPDMAVTDSRDLLASYRINTFNRSDFTLAHTGSVEHYTNIGGKTLVLAGSLQTASTRKFSDSYRIAASYGIKRFDTDNNGSAQTNLAHELSGNIDYRPPSRRFFLNFSEQFSMADGVASTNSQTSIFASGQLGNSTASNDRAQVSTQGYKRMKTSLNAEWAPRERLQLGGGINQEMFAEEGKETDLIWAVNAFTRYQMERLTANVAATFSDRSGSFQAGREIRGTASVAYYLSRDMNFGVRGGYTNAVADGASTTNLDMVQDFTYRHMTRTGIPRRLLEATEQFSYTRTAASRGSSLLKKKLTMGLTYYPWAALLVSNRLSYAWNDPGSQTELIYNGSIALSYPKFQASLDYSYGTRDAKNDKRKESRIAANVKKFF